MPTPFRARRSAPVHHINGNHDRDHLEVADNEQILGQSTPVTRRWIVTGGWRIASVARGQQDPCVRRTTAGFVLREADLLWLSRVAQKADRPLLVVSHVPVSGHAQTGNYYFQNNPSAHRPIPWRERARAGPLPRRKHPGGLPGRARALEHHHGTVDGITHLTQQSLTESFTTQGEPAGAFGLLELDDTVDWQVMGRDPIRFAFQPACSKWTPPLPDFSQHPEFAARRRGDIT